MNKTIWLAVILAVVLGLVAYVIWGQKSPTPTPATATFDPGNTTYSIENNPVTLIEGAASNPATTTLFSQPVDGDLNGDGVPDAAVILVQQPGGSGTFYYVAAAIATNTGAQGTNAILLGDRIAPQNVSIQNGKILVNYADRKPTDPMSTPPSVGVSKYFSYNGSALQEVTISTSSTPPATAGVGPGGHCGGNTTHPATCQAGYHCAPAPGSHLPFGDVGGVCVAN